MPYDVVAFATDELALSWTAAEEGIWHRLARHAWVNGSIPADPRELAGISRVSTEEFNAAWPALEPSWKLDATGMRRKNKKQEKERRFQSGKSVSARKSAEIRWGKQRATTMRNACEPPENSDATGMRHENKDHLNNGSVLSLNTVTTSNSNVNSTNFKDANAMRTHSERNASLPIPSPLNTNTPIVPKTSRKAAADYSAEFLGFWGVYPKAVGKGAAWKAWQAVKPANGTVEAILSAIETQKQSPQWLKDNGQFIPNPATWLNQRRWEDETRKPEARKRSVHDYL